MTENDKLEPLAEAVEAVRRMSESYGWALDFMERYEKKHARRK